MDLPFDLGIGMMVNIHFWKRRKSIVIPHHTSEGGGLLNAMILKQQMTEKTCAVHVKHTSSEHVIK